ncbi:GNAT family N-acetyltransferase [Flavobacterium sp.]|uniref:GNAT family N-acetyltransferase n=1 Tax=Flavobacterium sp. TaxID=239 RepID=UPI0039E539FC
MASGIQYRNARPDDAVKLSVLFKVVYIQTYGVEGVSDEFANFIAKQFSVERISNLIQNQPEALIVAQYQGNLVGVCEIAFAKPSPVGNITAPELNKLYILEWFCGKGIGSRLLEFAEKTARDQGETQMWLWVLESNHRAIEFYKRQDYVTIGNASFQMETNKYENKVMAKTL